MLMPKCGSQRRFDSIFARTGRKSAKIFPSCDARGAKKCEKKPFFNRHRPPKCIFIYLSINNIQRKCRKNKKK